MKEIVINSVAIASIVVYLYAIFCIVREMILVEQSVLEKEHKEIHFSLLMYYAVGFVGFFAWVLHNGIANGIQEILIREWVWLLLIMFSLIITSTTRHLKKERTGEDYHTCKKDFKL